MNQRINQLKSQKERIIKKNLNYWNESTTHCDYCKSYCHENCDCNFQIFVRCRVFNFIVFSENDYEICGYTKNNIEIENQEKERYEKEKRKTQSKKKKKKRTQ